MHNGFQPGASEYQFRNTQVFRNFSEILNINIDYRKDFTSSAYL